MRYFTLTHPAGDRYTRARVVAASNGLYGQLVDVKQRLIFAESSSDVHSDGILWNVLAAVAGDPTVLVEAEVAAVETGRVAEAPPPRRFYRAAAVLTVLLVIAGVVALRSRHRGRADHRRTRRRAGARRRLILSHCRSRPSLVRIRGEGHR